MSELLNQLGVEFSQMIILIIVIVACFVAIRISVQFNLNEYIERRGKSFLQKLMNACPHVELKNVGGGEVQSRLLFISPPGTVQWQCQRCGAAKYMNPSEGEEMQIYYAKNIKEYSKKMKRFSSLLKKSGHI